jgi:hypothetical protein
MATPETGGAGRPPAVGGPTGWALFAGVIAVILGFLDIFWGLAAILEDDIVFVGGEGVLIASVTAWGWVHLILGVILVLVGWGLFSAADWARWVTVFFAAVVAIAQIGVITAFPIWSFIVILLAVLIIYNLTARWEEPAA